MKIFLSQLQSRRQRTGGFTLIQLAITLVVLAILISFGVPALRNSRENANKSRIKANIIALDAAAERARIDGFSTTDPANTGLVGTNAPSALDWYKQHGYVVDKKTTITDMTVKDGEWGSPLVSNDNTGGASNGNVAGTALPGDMFAQAIPLSVSTGQHQISGNNTLATMEPGEPTVSNSVAIDKTLWFKFTAPATGNFAVTDANGGFSPIYGVFIGSPVSAIASVGEGASVVTPVTAGTTYYIRVASLAASGSPSGAFAMDLNFSIPPPNDPISGALPLSVPGNSSASNASATVETNEPGNMTSTVWWVFTMSDNATVTLSTAGSGFNTKMAVYQASGTAMNRPEDGIQAVAYTQISNPSVTGLTLVAANDDDPAGGVTSKVVFAASTGKTYYVQVGSAVPGETGTITLTADRVTLYGPPPNDNFANAISLPVGGSDTQINTEATTETGESNITKTIWYKFVVQNNGVLGVDTSAGSPVRMMAYQGTAFSNLAALTPLTNPAGSPAGTFHVTAGQTVFIQDGVPSGGPTGNVITSVTFTADDPPPANDDFANAIVLTPGTPDTKPNRFATTQTGEPGSMQKTIWYKFTSDGPGSLLIDASAGSPVNIAAYSGNSLTTLAPAALSPGPGGSATKILTLSGPGLTYYIQLGALTSTGNVTTSVTFTSANPPPNDNFANAVALTEGTSDSEVTTGATSEPGEPGPIGHTIWYKYQVTAPGTLRIDLSASDYPVRCAAFTGTAVNALQARHITWSTDGKVGLVVVDQVAPTVYIQLGDSSTGDVGRAALALSLTGVHGVPPPANDNFANAVTIDRAASSTPVDNRNATNEPNEPTPGITRTVWYRVVGFDGRLTVDTTGSSNFPRIAIYSGSNLASLTALAQCNGGTAGPNQTPVPSACSLSVETNADQPYYYIQAGADIRGFTGTLVVHTTAQLSPDNNRFAQAAPMSGSDTRTDSFALTNLEAGEPVPCDFWGYYSNTPVARSLWYKITPTRDGFVHWNVTGTGGNVISTLYNRGNSLDTIQPVTYYSGAGYPTLCVNDGDVRVSAGDTLYLRVAASLDNSNSFTVTTRDTPLPPGAANNDMIARAIEIPLNGSQTAYMQSATAEPGEPASCDWSGGPYYATAVRSVWYKFVTIPESGDMDITYSGGPINGTIYQGPTADVRNLTQVGTCGSRVRLLPGNTYWLRVSSPGDANGTFTTAFTPVLINDSFAQAGDLPVDGGSATGDTLRATLEPGEPAVPGYHYAGTTSAWYKLSGLTAVGDMHVNQVYTGFSGQVDIFSGTTLTALTSLVVGDSPRGGGSTTTSVTLTPGQTYYLRVSTNWSWNDAPVGGRFTLSTQFFPRPANDNFAAATPINLNGTTTGSTIASTIEAGETNPRGYQGTTSSVWHTITPAVNGNLTITHATDSNLSPMMYTGSAVNALTSFAAQSGGSPTWVFRLDAGVVYHWQEANQSSTAPQQGGYTLTTSFAAAPANDDFANAATLNLNGATTGTNYASRSEAGEPNNRGYQGGGYSVWYKISSPTDASLTLGSSSSANVTPIVYTGTALNNLAVYSPLSGSTYRLDANKVYYLQMDKQDFNGTPQGSFTITASTVAAPANDNFVDAAVLPLTGTTNGTNVAARRETNEPSQMGSGGATRTVWYKFNPSSQGLLTFNFTYNFNFGYKLYTGTSLTTLTAATPTTGDTYFVKPGTTYYMQIGDFNYYSGALEGNFAITPTLVGSPANDNFANAIPLAVDGATVSGTNVAATVEVGEASNGQYLGNTSSVWYVLNPTVAGRVTFSFTSTFNMGTTLYTGSSLATLAAQSPVSTNAYNLTPGTTYYLRVVDFNFNAPPQGTFTIATSYLSAPANDNFANAKVINNAVYQDSGRNDFATMETGEPTVCTTAASVWYKYAAPVDGTWTVSYSASFASGFAIYKGPAAGAQTLASLTQVGGCGNSTTQQVVTLTGGQNYYIKIGSAGAYGNFTLTANYAVDPALLPAVPGLVSFTNVQTGSATATMPPLPARTDSMNLQRSPDGYNGWTTLATGLAGGATFDDTVANIGTYYYRAVAVSTLGATNGAASNTTNTSIQGFNFSAGGDTNGIFYWLGTRRYTQAWSNPVLTGGLVTLSSSSILGGQSPIESITDRLDSHFHTNNIANSYVTFDLGAGNEIRLGSFAYKTRDNATSSIPVAVTVSGSNDGTNFTTLLAQTGMTTAQNTWANYPVPTQSVAYRYFRFTDNGNNTSDSYFTIGELELYGSRVVSALPFAPAAPTFSNITATSVTVTAPSLAQQASYFQIQRSTDNATFTTVQNNVPVNGTFNDTGLTTGQVYFYRIVGVNGFGSTNGPSAAVAPVTGGAATAAPSAPGRTAFTNITPTSHTVTMPSLPTGADASIGLTLQRSTDNTAFTTVQSNMAAGATADFSGLDSTKTYYYRAVAINTKGATPGPSAAVSPDVILDGTGGSPGVFYYLGTKKGTQAFSNPALAGGLVTTSVSGSYGIGVMTDATDELQSNFHTTPVANSWIQFDLGAGNSVNLSGYSYRARYDATTSIPTAWTLTASNDGTTWVTVDQRTGFTVAQNAWISFAPAATQTTAYRYWRLTQNADNSNSNYFTIGEIELYGSIAGTLNPSTPAAPTIAATATTNIDVKMPASSGHAETFTLQRSTDNATWGNITTGVAPLATYSDTSVAANTSYYYRVLAVNYYATSAASPSVQAVSASLPTAGSVLDLHATNVSAANGASIGTWPGSVGGNNGVAPAAANQPTMLTNAINGFPAVHFDGASRYFNTTATLPGSTPYTVVSVVRFNAVNGSGIVSWGNGATNQMTSIRGYTPSTILHDWFSNWTAGGSLFTNTWYLVEAVWDGTTRTTKVNGQVVAQDTPTGRATATTIARVGSTVLNEHMNGDIADVTVYNTALNTSQLGSVENYYNAKYNLIPPAPPAPVQLSSTDPTTVAVVMPALPANASSMKLQRSLDGVAYSDISAGVAAGATYSDTGRTTGTLYYYRAVALWSTSSVNGAAASIVAGGQGYTPPASGTILDLHASTLNVANGASIPTWTDPSGNDAVQLTAATQPTLLTGAVNGQPAVHFNGSNYLFTSKTMPSGASPYSIVSVVRFSAISGSGIVSWGNAATNQMTSLRGLSGPSVLHDWYSNDNRGGSLFTGTWYVIEAIWDGTTRTTKVNGQVIAQDTPTGKNTGGTVARVGSTILSENMNGDIADLTVYNRALTSGEQTTIENYYDSIYSLIPPQPPTAVQLTSPSATTVAAVMPALPQNASAMALQRSLDGVTYADIATGLAAGATYTDTGLTTGTRYFYRASAVWNSTRTAGIAASIIAGGAGYVVPTSGAVLDLHASTLSVANGASVRTWTDPNGNDAVQLTSTSQPTLTTNVINGQPAVHFGASQMMVSSKALPGGNSSYSVVSVARFPTTSNNAIIGWGNAATNQANGFRAAGSGFYNYWYSNDVLGTPLPANTWVIVEAIYNGTTRTLKINGKQVAQDSPVGKATGATVANIGLGIAAQGDYLNGDIADLTVYNRALTSGEQTSLENYYNSLYNLLPPNPPDAVQLSSSDATTVQATLPALPAASSGMVLQRSTDGSTFTDLATNLAGGAVYSDTGLTTGTRYYYRASAIWNAQRTPGVMSSVIAGGQAANPYTTGAVLRLNASSLSLANGASISTWPDIGGNDAVTTNTTATTLPSFVTNAINGQPAVRFAGGDRHLATRYALPGGTTPYAVVSVVRFTATTLSAIMGWGNAATNQAHGLRAASGGLYDYWYSNDILGGTLNTGTWYLVEDLFDGTTRSLRINGTTVAQDTPAGKNTGATVANIGLGIAPQNDFMNGDVADILVYNTALTPANLLSIENALNDQYALFPPSVPGNVTLVSPSPTTIAVTLPTMPNYGRYFSVQRSTDNITYTTVATGQASASTYTDTGLTTGTRYYYRPIAVNGSLSTTGPSASYIAGASSVNDLSSGGILLTGGSGDANGVFYFLGSNNNTANWANPATTSKIAITASAPSGPSGTLDMLTDRAPSDFHYGNTPTYYQFDLTQGNSLLLKTYSLRSRSSAGHNPVTWKLEGSNDNSVWTTLDTRSGVTWASTNQWQDFTVTNAPTFYRYFRITQTGLNSSGYNFFCLGEIELYGGLEAAGVPSAPSALTYSAVTSTTATITMPALPRGAATLNLETSTDKATWTQLQTGLAGGATYNFTGTSTNVWFRAVAVNPNGTTPGAATNPNNATAGYTYVSNGDANGMFYALATQMGNQPWTNPHTAGYLTVSCNTGFAGGTASMLVDRSTSSLWSTDTANSYFQVDMKTYEAAITAYSIRDRDTGDHTPAQWRLEGSDDAVTWKTLDTRSGITWTGGGQWQTFTIPNPQRAYRYTRFLQTGVNNSNYNYLILGEMEFYGSLVGALPIGLASPPTLVSPNATSVTITLPAMPPGASSMSLQRSLDGTTYTTVATGQAGGAAFSDTGLTTGNRYYYRAVGVRGSSANNGAAASIVPGEATATNTFTGGSGDANGVFYYLGTNYGSSAWTNPTTSGAISISSVAGSPSGDPLTDRAASNWNTANTPNAYVQVDLKTNALLPKSYSIQGRASYNTSAMATWKFEGSADGTAWTTLDTQSGIAWGVAEWKNFSIPNAPRSYRYFKVTQTGASTSNDNFMCLGEIELYGTLEGAIQPATPGAVSLSTTSGTSVTAKMPALPAYSDTLTLERSTDNVTFSPVATGLAGGATYTDTAVTTPNRYFYRAAAVKFIRRTASVTSSIVPGSTASSANLNGGSGDANGVFYYLGTNYGSSAWTNPTTSGAISISSVAGSPSGDPLTDRAASNWNTANTPNAYVQVDLKTNTLLPQSYSVQGRASYNSSAMTAWKFEGSADGSAWTTLDTQSGITTWAIAEWKNFSIASAPGTYRYFKLTQTAPTTNNDNFLCLGEVELYGQLEASSPPSAPSAPTVTVSSSTSAAITMPALPGLAKSLSLQRAPDGVNFTTVASNLAAGAQLSDSNLTTGATYYYRAVAVNPAGLAAGPSVSVNLNTFDPTTVTGMQVWLKADALSLADGATVSTWTDSSSNGKNATASTGTSVYKAAVVNGKPAVRFSSSMLKTAAAINTGAAPRTLLVAYKSTATGSYSNAAAGEGTTAATGNWFYLQARTSSVTGDPYFAGYGADAGSGLSTPDNAWKVASVTYDGTTVRLYKNGALLDTQARTLNTISDGLRVGNSGGSATEPFAGDIAEVMMFGSALSGSDRQSLEQYLLGKYGITVGTPSAPNAPTVGATGATSTTVTLPALPTGATSLTLQKSTDNVNFTSVATGQAAGATYSDTGLTVGATYYYRAVSANATALTAGPVTSFAVPTAIETLTYASNGDTNGIFYRLGTNYGAQAWTNPHTAGFVTIGGFNGSGTAAGTAAGAVDRVATDDNGITTNAAGNYWMATFPSGTGVNPNAISIRARPTGTGTASNVASYKVQGSQNGSAWTDIATVSGLTYVTEADYKVNSFTAPGTFYRYIRLLHNGNVTTANQYFFLTDWEIYGQLGSSAPAGTPSAPVLTSPDATTMSVTLPALPRLVSSLSLQRSTDNVSFTTIATGLSGGATYSDTGLTTGTRYYYRAVGVYSVGSNTGPSANYAAGAVATTVERTYVSNGDTNGIFYFMGTNYGASAWVNPMNASGAYGIKCAANGTVYDPTSGSGWLNGTLAYRAATTNRTGDLAHSDNLTPSYMIFDLGQANSLKPKGINIQQRCDANYSIPNLYLDGSNDGTTWTRVMGNTAMTGGQSVWSYLTVSGASSSYRYLKITTDNAYMHIGEVEFYGTFTYIH